MTNSMTVSFQLKKFREDENGKMPIYCRITVNGNRTEFSIKRSIEEQKWLAASGMAKGTTEEIKILNSYLTSIRLKLQEHYRKLLDNDKHLTPEAIKNLYFGISEKSKTIVEVFEFHNKQVECLIDKDYSIGTLERYRTALKHIKEFLNNNYNISDIPVKQINLEMINSFEYYLKVQRKCNHNTAMKYITNLRKIIRLCYGNEWIDRDPFVNYKFHLNEVEREYLSQEEVQQIIDKQFQSARLDQVRDIFIFCCFTGLAYADVKKLSKTHLILGIDRERWIKINRTKTDTRSSVPLLPTPKAILEKYENHPKCIAENTLLPVFSNQKMNEYLKEIGAVCGINKTITFHIARHTFATTITLSNDVPIESVSKMLGHKSIRTTQHYAKVIDKKVGDDMQMLKSKFLLEKAQKVG